MTHPAKTCNRGDIDDRSMAPTQHLGPQMLAEQEGPQQVDIHHPLPLFDRGVFGRPDEKDRGIVDQYICGAKIALDLRSESLYETLRGNIANDRVGDNPLGTQARQRGLKRLDIRDYNLVSGAPQPPGGSKTKALRSTRNYSGFHLSSSYYETIPR